MTVASSRMNINLRAEFRLALLAAAEACWIYAVVLTVGAFAGFPREVTPPGIFLVYWLGLLTGRLLPRRQEAWRTLQFATVGIAIFAILAGIRVGLYEDVPTTDLSWLATYFSRVLAFFERASAEEISTLALLFAFVRGLGFAQRPLTLWVVGFRFRLGVVIFFVTALFAALATNVNFVAWVFVYFALSLLAIALARIEEAGQEHPLGWKWALVLGGALAVTMLFGFLLTRFFTLESVSAFFALLSPLAIVVEVIFAIIAIPILFFLEFVLQLVTPLLQRVLDVLGRMFPTFDLGSTDVIERAAAAVRQLEPLLPYARLAGIVLVLALIGWLVARALNRRMQWVENEIFVREALDEREAIERETEKQRRAKRPARREIHAENVRRIYAALLAHAEGLGLARRDAETPLEFLPRLTARFPDSAGDLRTLTDAYVAVHYAQRPASETQVRELRAVWQRIKERMTKDQRSKTKS